MCGGYLGIKDDDSIWNNRDVLEGWQRDRIEGSPGSDSWSSVVISGYSTLSVCFGPPAHTHGRTVHDGIAYVTEATQRGSGNGLDSTHTQYIYYSSIVSAMKS